MAKKKNTFCADTSKMTDTEKKIMATAMKQGEEQINIVRQAKKQEPQEEQDSQESENEWMILRIFSFPFPIDPSELENPYYDYEDLEEDFEEWKTHN